MKERPILFSAPMVRAILAGRKTQTRRMVKPQPDDAGWLYPQPMHGRSPDGVAFGDPYLWRMVGPDYPDNSSDNLRCPWAVGDRLWIRESWRVIRDGGTPDVENDTDCTIEYVADCATQTFSTGKRLYPARERVSPSIHLPRWASRLLLEIVEVRVQRLRDISDADARAEGVSGRGEFALLWESIHGVRSWQADSWVWAISFKVLPAQR